VLVIRPGKQFSFQITTERGRSIREAQPPSSPFWPQPLPLVNWNFAQGWISYTLQDLGFTLSLTLLP